MRKILFFILTVLLLSIPVLADGVPEMPCFDLPSEVDTVKVGLYSGSSALSYAELEGVGYEVGFFDFARSFHPFGSLNSGSVTLWADNAWHVKLSALYASLEEAAVQAAQLGGFPAYIDSAFRVLYGSYSDANEANAAAAKYGFDGSAYTGSGESVIAADSSYGTLLFLFDSPGRYLSLRSAGVTRLGDCSYKGDFRFSRNGACLCVTNYVGLEDYVKGVLPYEVGADWPAEALKAQAVCARTYAINNVNGYAERDFDVRNDTYSQVYKGCTYSDEAIEAAANDTAGQFVRSRGAVCKVYYMSSDGGGTEDGVNVFGERRSYLKAVADTVEVASDFYGKTWKETFTPLELSYRLTNRGYPIGEIAEATATYSDMGNVIRIDFIDVDGNALTIERLECYTALGLNSIRYDLLTEETDNGTLYVFDGCGWGHNCGMSQWGACSMAQNPNITCNDIIGYYFTGAYIA